MALAPDQEKNHPLPAIDSEDIKVNLERQDSFGSPRVKLSCPNRNNVLAAREPARRSQRTTLVPRTGAQAPEAAPKAKTVPVYFNYVLFIAKSQHVSLH